jgi:ABC-type hemin transport system ATPase subunit
LAAIKSNSSMPQIKDHDQLLPLANSLVKDVNAVGIIVHKVNLATNSRTTVLAIANGERNHKLEGLTVSLFAASPERNADVSQC